MHALILAGGRGTRLLGLTAARAKPAVAFAGTLRLLDFALSNCLNSGITRLSLLTQYRADTIAQHLRGDWFNHQPGGVQIAQLPSARRQGDRGTADAVHQHLGRLRSQGVRQVLVLAGSHVCKLDLRHLLDAHAASGAGITVSALRMPAQDAAGASSVLHTMADGQALVDIGAYAANLDLLQALLALDADDPLSGHDIGQDVLPRAAAEGLLGVHLADSGSAGHPGTAACWRDVGTLDGYWRAHHDLTGHRPVLDLFDPAWPLHTRPQALQPTQLAPAHAGQAGMAGCLVGGGCRIDAASVHGSVLSNGVQIGAGSVVEDCVLLPGAVLGRRVQLRRVVLDEHCRLPDGIRIGFDAAEDGARFQVTAGGVTLVTAARLGALPLQPRPAAVRSAAGTAAAAGNAPPPPGLQPALQAP